MKIPIFIPLLIPFLITSCVFSRMGEGLTALEGENISKAIEVLGYPDQQQTIGTDTVYTWSRGFQSSYTVPQTSTTTGYVGTTPVYGTTTTNSVRTSNHHCLIKIGTNDKGIIKMTEAEGTVGGCASYADRLKSFADSKNKQ